VNKRNELDAFVGSSMNIYSVSSLIKIPKEGLKLSADRQTRRHGLGANNIRIFTHFFANVSTNSKKSKQVIPFILSASKPNFKASIVHNTPHNIVQSVSPNVSAIFRKYRI
jgi:hypothetical protein